MLNHRKPIKKEQTFMGLSNFGNKERDLGVGVLLIEVNKMMEMKS